MGLRFRRTTKIGPFRLTASRSGLGWSVGSRGARYGVGPTGIRHTTVTLPGTGISYVTTSRVRGRPQVSHHVARVVFAVLLVLGLRACAMVVLRVT